MQVPLKITMRGIEHSEAIEEKIQQKAAKLELHSEKITSCNVTIELHQKHKLHGKLYNVKVLVNMPPKKELISTHNEQENLYLSIRDAFDDIIRQIEETSKKMQGDVKAHAPTLHGEIARLFELDGFGFITDAEGEEYYFNADSLTHLNFDRLKVGTPVQFIEKVGDEGLRACRVSAKASR